MTQRIHPDLQFDIERVLNEAPIDRPSDRPEYRVASALKCVLDYIEDSRIDTSYSNSLGTIAHNQVLDDLTELINGDVQGAS